jgi:hypothetical protein
VQLDGFASVKVVSRLGILHLPRQVCYQPASGTHTLPGNALLPAHNGMIITRPLQEWACLLAQDLPFETVQRLLGWQTQTPAVLSSTEVRQLVRTHGQVVRQAEAHEVQALLAQGDLAGLQPRLVPAEAARRPATWPAELNAAVATALAAEAPQPPAGVSAGDWARVLTARRAEPTLTAATLARLGPTVQPNQVVVALDEVKVRQPTPDAWWELRTARIATPQGYRYLSGTGVIFLQQVCLLLVLCGGGSALVTLLADGARWIRNFFTEQLTQLPRKELILDWYHLRKKCYELLSMICRNRQDKAQLLGRLLSALWSGEVEAALADLEAYRPEAKNTAKLDELISYLQNRRTSIPNYKLRRQARQFNGSGQVEKANDLIVARRQKHQGMHWSQPTTDALAALKTLTLNRGWDLYWQKGQVLPLVAA